ncbi:MAG: putative AlkP superfamily pyrophosphatase or phosphodiesterase [Polaribacter sp.]|jgi:predicted AlkP superfamily pyrophosphatase or phosphodiesterase
MKKITSILILSTIFFISCKSQETKQQKPKLVVGIVIDQMRYDYLTRFTDRFGENGFKRLLNNGFSIENAYYNCIPTYTAVGHASIYTGTTPDSHGIISNNWYDRFLKKSIYCVDDNNYKTVGNTSDTGNKSPFRMYTTTVTDQLHLAQNMNGKTIGIAIKDRSAILPAGHTANGAYWFDGGKNGQWISSTFYMESLPKWVTDFNSSGKANDYLKNPWNSLYAINTYTNSIVDDNIFEGKFKGETTTSFPHDIPSLKASNGNFDILKGIPAGNSFTADFTKAAIIGENLGKSKFTDFLAISFSSTDYVGHQYGPASKEIEDTYLRLDKDLADLLSFLDKQVGENNYTVFLTADHAAVDVPSYLQSLKIPAHYFDIKKFRQAVLAITKKYFNSIELIENISNYQIFLDKQKIESLGLDKNTVAEKLAEEVIALEGIYKAVTAKTLQTARFTDGIMNSLQNGYNQKFSGDVLLIPFPATLIRGRTGTSHGSGYSYDAHIPLIFYGNGIKKGVSKKRYEVIDIAPTIANLLKIEVPNASTGKIIDEALK